MGEFNTRQYEAARRAWEASAAEGIDTKTQKALERLSATYFWASMGFAGGRRGADQPINAPRLRAGTQRD